MTSCRSFVLRTAVACALIVLAAPLFAQVDDFGAKMNTIDYNEATHERPSRAVLALEDAQRQAAKVEKLEAKRDDEGLSAKEEKKLAKALERTHAGYQRAIDADTSWTQVRMEYGAFLYNRGELASARDVFDGLLEVDPAHDSAKAYRDMCAQRLAEGGEVGAGDVAGGGAR